MKELGLGRFYCQWNCRLRFELGAHLSVWDRQTTSEAWKHAGYRRAWEIMTDLYLGPLFVRVVVPLP